MKRTALLPLALLLLSCCACTGVSHEKDPGITLPLYFLARAESAHGGDVLRRSDEHFDLPESAPPLEKAQAVVERLLSGSQDDSLLTPFPSDAELISISIRNARAYVDLSGISRLKGIELTLADYCLTLSLTAIDGIESISVTGNGHALVQQPRRIFYPHDVLLSTGDSVLQRIEVTLHFMDSNGVLTPETRTLDVYEGETQSAVLIAALLAGPENSELTSPIPEDFSIGSIKVENGVCSINLPAASLSMLPDDELSQQRILWSLAESLYSLAYIEELRLVADGVELEYFGCVPTAGIAQRPQG